MHVQESKIAVLFISVMLSLISVTLSLVSFRQGMTTIRIDRIYCNGAESSLLSCNRGREIGVGYCYGDAGVVCPCKFDVIIQQNSFENHGAYIL